MGRSPVRPGPETGPSLPPILNFCLQVLLTMAMLHVPKPWAKENSFTILVGLVEKEIKAKVGRKEGGVNLPLRLTKRALLTFKRFWLVKENNKKPVN